MISSLRSKFDLFNIRAVYISADKLSVYHLDRGNLGSTYLFDIDEDGRKNFRRYLEEAENTPIYLLVDLIEEEFRQDTIPHVFGSDREALIERKQSRLFRDAKYFYTRNQGREQEGRRDDRLLFMALTSDDTFQPWLALLEEYKVPLKGILSVPLLLQSFIKNIPDVSDHALFVTMQSISGLRQTYFQNKELKLSRLSKLPRYGTESYAPRILSEVDKIQRYLNSLRLVSGDKSLDVYVLADKTTLDEFEKERKSSPLVKYHLLDINKLSGSFGIELEESIPFIDQLLLFHLLSARPSNCYASAHEMRYAKLRNVRYAMNVFSISFLLISLIYSGFNLMSGLIYTQQSKDAKLKADFYQTRYDLAKERLPKTPVSSQQIKVAVDAINEIEKYKASPYEMFVTVGKTLEKFPDIKLDNIDWQFSMKPDITDNNNENEFVPEQDEAETVMYYQISKLNAHIEPFEGNYREAIAMVNKFAETLKEKKQVHDIKILSMPLDISSSATLQGNTEVVAKFATFSMEVIIGVN